MKQAPVCVRDRSITAVVRSYVDPIQLINERVDGEQVSREGEVTYDGVDGAEAGDETGMPSRVRVSRALQPITTRSRELHPPRVVLGLFLVCHRVSAFFLRQTPVQMKLLKSVFKPHKKLGASFVVVWKLCQGEGRVTFQINQHEMAARQFFAISCLIGQA